MREKIDKLINLCSRITSLSFVLQTFEDISFNGHITETERRLYCSKLAEKEYIINCFLNEYKNSLELQELFILNNNILTSFLPQQEYIFDKIRKKLFEYKIQIIKSEFHANQT